MKHIKFGPFDVFLELLYVVIIGQCFNSMSQGVGGHLIPCDMYVILKGVGNELDLLLKENSILWKL